MCAKKENVQKIAR